MKNFSTSKKILLSLVFVNLVFFATYFFFFSTVKNLNQESSTLAFEIDFFEERERTLTDLERMLEEVAPQSERVNEYFIQPGGIPEFFEEMEDFASRSGVDLNISVERADLENYEEIEVLELSLGIRGGREQVFGFISFLEFIPYQTDLDRLNLEEISRTGPEGEPAVWRASTNLRVLKLK